jgi:hypothetical protein
MIWSPADAIDPMLPRKPAHVARRPDMITPRTLLTVYLLRKMKVKGEFVQDSKEQTRPERKYPLYIKHRASLGDARACSLPLPFIPLFRHAIHFGDPLSTELNHVCFFRRIFVDASSRPGAATDVQTASQGQAMSTASATADETAGGSAPVRPSHALLQLHSRR